MTAAPLQQPIPDLYHALPEEELHRRLRTARETLGDAVVLLGHHYQRDDVIRYADFQGDSLKLAAAAQSRPAARYIVFLGVHFMAETADILSRPDQKVLLPDLDAGCSMADMAEGSDVETAHSLLTGDLGPSLLPLTYVNSSARVKAFVGRQGGAVLTSASSPAVMSWGLRQAERVLFLPDRHLGHNTAVSLGVSESSLAVWDPDSLTLSGAPDPRVVLWHGYCSVHQRFTPAQIRFQREQDPEVRIIVHPECSREVVAAADAAGSTEFIIAEVAKAPPGSHLVIGTEINLVHRLAALHPNKRIHSLSETICPCATMYRISPQQLLWTLESLVRGEEVNVIRVDGETAEGARLALDRMLEIVQG